MTQTSEIHFITLKTEDPATNSGIISLYKVIKFYYNKVIKITQTLNFIKKLMPIILYQDCVPYIPDIGLRKQKTPIFGDQGLHERGEVE